MPALRKVVVELTGLCPGVACDGHDSPDECCDTDQGNQRDPGLDREMTCVRSFLHVGEEVDYNQDGNTCQYDDQRRNQSPFKFRMIVLQRSFYYVLLGCISRLQDCVRTCRQPRLVA